MSTWLKINIGGNENLHAPIKIEEDEMYVSAKCLQTLALTLQVPNRVKELPIEILYCSDEKANTVVKADKIFLVKESGVFSAISAFCNKVKTLTIEVFFNDNKEGLCLGFLVDFYKPLRYIVRLNGVNNAMPINEKDKVPDLISAKSVFHNSVLCFSQLISNIETSFDIQEWEKTIKEVDKEGVLLKVFDVYRESPNGWLTILKSWGLKKDACKQYVGSIADETKYSTIDSSGILPDSSYLVALPCWTIWIDSNGTRQEKLVAKGLLKKI